MTQYLGSRSKRGALMAANPFFTGGWAVTFSPADLAVKEGFEIYHIAVRGPQASQMQFYVDETFYDITVRGDINSWDPAQAMYVRPGQTLYFYWNTNTGSAPTVTLFPRQPSPL